MVRPASLRAMGWSGRTIAVRGRTWAGRPDTPPQRTPRLVCIMGGSGLTNAERGKPGMRNLDTPPRRWRNPGAERRLPPRRTMGLSGRTIAGRGRVGRGVRTLPLGATREAQAKRVGTVALSAPQQPGMRAGCISSIKKVKYDSVAFQGHFRGHRPQRREEGVDPAWAVP